MTTPEDHDIEECLVIDVPSGTTVPLGIKAYEVLCASQTAGRQLVRQ